LVESSKVERFSSIDIIVSLTGLILNKFRGISDFFKINDSSKVFLSDPFIFILIKEIEGESSE